MPQVGGRALTQQLRRAVDAQAAVTRAARQVAQDVAAERVGGPAQDQLGQLEPDGTKVPGPAGTTEAPQE